MRSRNADWRTYAILALRRASYRWRARSEAVKKARVGRGLYECAICKKHIKTKEKQLDHVNPVMPIGVVNPSLDIIAERMLCEVEGWQVLCKTPCHSEKSKKENELRRFYKANKQLTNKPRKARISKYVYKTKTRKAT